MASARVARRHPPSPPASNDEEYHAGLQQVLEHSASTESYQGGQAYHSDGLYTHSGQQQYGHGDFMDQYANPEIYQIASGREYPLIQQLEQPTFVRTSQLNTPPGTLGLDDGIRTRSGRSIPPAGSPLAARDVDLDKSRKSPKVKKSKAKSGKATGPEVNKPLSILTKDYTHIPVKDMGQWVNRLADVRHLEVEMKKDKKIARPMNSFMLYRSAYAERTKEFCRQNNHQVVSRVSGASWPLEPKAIRDLYEGYASLERDNHHKAHPDYKFAPNKSQNSRKRKVDEENEEPSDLDDADLDYGRSSSRKHGARTKRYRNDDDHSFRSDQSMPFDPSRTAMYPHPDMNRSSWQYTNPGKPVPLFHSDLSRQYTQMSVHQSRMGHNVEDVRYRRMEPPGAQFGGTGSVIGLPNGNHSALLHESPPEAAEQHFDPRLMDPQMLQLGQGQYGHNSSAFGQTNQGNYGHSYIDPQMEQYYPNVFDDDATFGQDPRISGHQAQSNYHPGNQTLTREEQWNPGTGGEAGAGGDWDKILHD